MHTIKTLTDAKSPWSMDPPFATVGAEAGAGDEAAPERFGKSLSSLLNGFSSASTSI